MDGIGARHVGGPRAESGIRYAPSGFIGRQADALATDRLRGIWKSTGGTFAKNSE